MSKDLTGLFQWKPEMVTVNRHRNSNLPEWQIVGVTEDAVIELIDGTILPWDGKDVEVVGLWNFRGTAIYANGQKTHFFYYGRETFVEATLEVAYYPKRVDKACVVRVEAEPTHKWVITPEYFSQSWDRLRMEFHDQNLMVQILINGREKPVSG